MEVLRQYGTATTILFPLITRGAQDFETTITFVAADTQISKNEAAFANTGSVPVHEGNGIFSLALTATEMQAARIVITCIDAATKVWEDQAIIIQTFGNASAGLGFQLHAAAPSVNTIQINSDTLAATQLAFASGTIVSGTVEDAGFTPTTTEFEVSDITEATADHFKDRVVIFRPGLGALDNQAKDITAYSLVGGRGHFTVSALTEAPADAS